MLFNTFKYINNIDNSIQLITNFDLIKSLNKITSKQILKNITNVGQIEPKKLGLYLGAADAVIFLLGNNFNEKACFPIRIGSYLNGERVIIINDNNAEAVNTLKKYGSCITNKNIKILAKSTVHYLNNQNKIIEDKVKKAKTELSWDKLINKLIHYYRII